MLLCSTLSSSGQQVTANYTRQFEKARFSIDNPLRLVPLAMQEQAQLISCREERLNRAPEDVAQFQLKINDKQKYEPCLANLCFFIEVKENTLFRLHFADR